MNKYSLSLIALSFFSIATANFDTKVVNVKPELNKKFMVKAYTREFDNLYGRADNTPEGLVREALKNTTVKILLANKKTAGFIAYDKTGHIDSIYVDPKHRSKGYSKTLLDTAKQSLRKRGIKNMQLKVFDYNPKAVTAFKKAGFSKKKKTGRLIQMSKKI